MLKYNPLESSHLVFWFFFSSYSNVISECLNTDHRAMTFMISGSSVRVLQESCDYYSFFIRRAYDFIINSFGSGICPFSSISTSNRQVTRGFCNTS